MSLYHLIGYKLYMYLPVDILTIPNGSYKTFLITCFRHGYQNEIGGYIATII